MALCLVYMVMVQPYYIFGNVCLLDCHIINFSKKSNPQILHITCMYEHAQLYVLIHMYIQMYFDATPKFFLLPVLALHTPLTVTKV